MGGCCRPMRCTWRSWGTLMRRGIFCAAAPRSTSATPPSGKPGVSSKPNTARPKRRETSSNRAYGLALNPPAIKAEGGGAPVSGRLGVSWRRGRATWRRRGGASVGRWTRTQGTYRQSRRGRGWRGSWEIIRTLGRYSSAPLSSCHPPATTRWPSGGPTSSWSRTPATSRWRSRFTTAPCGRPSYGPTSCRSATWDKRRPPPPPPASTPRSRAARPAGAAGATRWRWSGGGRTERWTERFGLTTGRSRGECRPRP
mmetsp:Transcript_24127/g.48866  ORF Transcript_24127/g.48866 Transcript_24127/m.48866 type:complete len:255 (+) Transcript_24127:1250-2014(+)